MKSLEVTWSYLWSIELLSGLGRRRGWHPEHSKSQLNTALAPRRDVLWSNMGIFIGRCPLFLYRNSMLYAVWMICEMKLAEQDLYVIVFVTLILSIYRVWCKVFLIAKKRHSFLLPCTAEVALLLGQIFREFGVRNSARGMGDHGCQCRGQVMPTV